ncbi:hypothetical protein L915_07036, partial [Phytophthora nicotianae]
FVFAKIIQTSPSTIFHSPSKSATTLMNRINEITNRKQWDDTNPASPKRIRRTGGFGHGIGQSTNVPLKRGMDHVEILELIRLGQDIHRQKCRENQRRFRKKQNDWIADMEKINEQLRVEVNTLTKRHQTVTSKILGENNIWVVVTQFFRLFRHGLALGPNQTTDFNQQMDFIEESMTPDVATNVGFGPESMISSWRFLQWFDDVYVELEGLRGGDTVLTAITKTNATITTETLRNLFPRELNSEQGSCSAIADGLIGKRVVLHGSTAFIWDRTSGRVVSVLAQSNMLTPMLHLLGNLEDVSGVFENALIRINCQAK